MNRLTGTTACILACLFWFGHGRRIRASDKKLHRIPSSKTEKMSKVRTFNGRICAGAEANPLRALVRLLFAGDLTGAFNIAVHPSVHNPSMDVRFAGWRPRDSPIPAAYPVPVMQEDEMERLRQRAEKAEAKLKELEEKEALQAKAREENDTQLQGQNRGAQRDSSEEYWTMLRDLNLSNTVFMEPGADPAKYFREFIDAQEPDESVEWLDGPDLKQSDASFTGGDAFDPVEYLDDLVAAREWNLSITGYWKKKNDPGPTGMKAMLKLIEAVLRFRRRWATPARVALVLAVLVPCLVAPKWFVRASTFCGQAMHLWLPFAFLLLSKATHCMRCLWNEILTDTMFTGRKHELPIANAAHVLAAQHFVGALSTFLLSTVFWSGGAPNGALMIACFGRLALVFGLWRWRDLTDELTRSSSEDDDDDPNRILLRISTPPSDETRERLSAWLLRTVTRVWRLLTSVLCIAEFTLIARLGFCVQGANYFSEPVFGLPSALGTVLLRPPGPLLLLDLGSASDEIRNGLVWLARFGVGFCSWYTFGYFLLFLVIYYPRDQWRAYIRPYPTPVVETVSSILLGSLRIRRPSASIEELVREYKVRKDPTGKERERQNEIDRETEEYLRKYGPSNYNPNKRRTGRNQPRTPREIEDSYAKNFYDPSWEDRPKDRITAEIEEEKAEEKRINKEMAIAYNFPALDEDTQPQRNLQMQLELIEEALAEGVAQAARSASGPQEKTHQQRPGGEFEFEFLDEKDLTPDEEALSPASSVANIRAMVRAGFAGEDQDDLIDEHGFRLDDEKREQLLLVLCNGTYGKDMHDMHRKKLMLTILGLPHWKYDDKRYDLENIKSFSVDYSEEALIQTLTGPEGDTLREKTISVFYASGEYTLTFRLTEKADWIMRAPGDDYEKLPALPPDYKWVQYASEEEGLWIAASRKMLTDALRSNNSFPAADPPGRSPDSDGLYREAHDLMVSYGVVEGTRPFGDIPPSFI